MIFSEDAILLSFFSRYEDDEGELKDAIVKYSKGSSNLEAHRPSTIEPTKGDPSDLDMVRILTKLIQYRQPAQLIPLSISKKESDLINLQQQRKRNLVKKMAESSV